MILLAEFFETTIADIETAGALKQLTPQQIDRFCVVLDAVELLAQQRGQVLTVDQRRDLLKSIAMWPVQDQTQEKILQTLQGLPDTSQPA